MDFIRRTSRRITPFVLAAFSLLSLHIPAAQAGMIAPSTYAQQSVAGDAHKKVQQFLARDEIRAELVKLGVDPAQAQARVETLSNEEATLAAERLQQLPAGGDGGGIVGAIVFIFLVLLLTDLLGLTDVYPFVKKHR
ncbi:MAG: PA2779 family protein [Gammaproteobacteria bacterium]|nr:PA2779 family protein [Gammaproteobacteria bacterium]